MTLTTVGYGDYSPETSLGRWLAAFVMAGGIGAVAILTGILADEIREARIHDEDETPELDDDIEHVMAIMAAELQKLQAKVSHPEVVAALRKVHHESPRRRRCEPTPSPPFPRRRPRGGPRPRPRVHRLRRGRRHRVLRRQERPDRREPLLRRRRVRATTAAGVVLLVLRRPRRQRPLRPGHAAQRRRPRRGLQHRRERPPRRLRLELAARAPAASAARRLALSGGG